MTKGMVENPLIVVIGATGTGKSQLAVDLAKRFNGEIINGDAMQMYNGLPVITNKISVEEQQGIPHHLLGIAEVGQQPWCVNVFKRKAAKIIEEIRSRGRLPILVGGTHYYTQSLLLKEGLTGEEIEGQVEEISRAEIGRKYPILEGPTKDMLDQLRIVDPAMANRWHPKDRRKIQRSLEIYLMTGKRASKAYEEQKASVATDDNSLLTSTMIFWVHADKEILRARLDDRVDKMMTAGLIDEVKALDKILSEKRAAGNAVDRSSGIWVSIGFKEFEPYLTAIKSGMTSVEDTNIILAASIESTKAATRQYAKRQVQWIRHKLLTALSEAKVLDRIYLLDGTNLDDFPASVSMSAIKTVQKFLAKEELPTPDELSPRTADLLIPKHDVRFQERRGSWTPWTCELCGLTYMTEDESQQHLKGRRHRMRIRKSARVEEYTHWKAQEETKKI